MIKTHGAKGHITAVVIRPKRQLALSLAELFLPRLKCTFQPLIFFVLAFDLGLFLEKLLPPNLQISLLLSNVLFSGQKSSFSFCENVLMMSNRHEEYEAGWE